MKYVALLSGGKDSCFNLLHCEVNGHELVAAASLRPPEGQDEIDSFLYQSVGQDAISLIAQALNVPLYCGYIKGSAIDQSLEYGANDGDDVLGVVGDETEDLFQLLSSVKEAHPEIEAVSAGAILSNYQRIRVEHVCQRLDLTSLCYLWQRRQDELLTEMIDTGIDAVLIKVAGIGLTSRHLKKRISELKAYLFDLNDRYGAHICGEGGEYETFTLDCPLFCRKIQLADTQVVTHADNDFASVYYLRIRKADLVNKMQSNCDLSSLRECITPPLLEQSGLLINELLQTTFSPKIIPRVGMAYCYDDASSAIKVSTTQNWLCLSNVHISSIEKMTLEEEAERCFATVQKQLESNQLKMKDVVSVNLFLSAITYFAEVNLIYQRYFRSAPPARTCVAVQMPKGRRISMEVVAFNPAAGKKKTLQVRSLSHWAPAVIGPYSQAVMVDGFVFISGQIGLIPSRHSLPNCTSLSMETALSLQHAKRIAEAFNTMHSISNILLAGGWVIWADSPENLGSVVRCWSNKQLMSEFAPSLAAPAVFIVAESLPKSAMVEIQLMLLQAQDEDNEPFLGVHAAAFQPQLVTKPFTRIEYFSLKIEQAFERGFAVIYLDVTAEDCAINDTVSTLLSSAISIRLFCLGNQLHGTDSIHRLAGSSSLPVTTIPVRYICDRHGKPWECVAFVHFISQHQA